MYKELPKHILVPRLHCPAFFCTLIWKNTGREPGLLGHDDFFQTYKQLTSQTTKFFTGSNVFHSYILNYTGLKLLTIIYCSEIQRMMIHVTIKLYTIKVVIIFIYKTKVSDMKIRILHKESLYGILMAIRNSAMLEIKCIDTYETDYQKPLDQIK